MSVKILNDALKADRLKLKGGALQLLWLICFRCGSGHPTKWGRVMPLGEWRATDKKIMRLMHLNTKKDVRTTLKRWRKALKAAGVLSWVINHADDKPGWPCHLYTVDTVRLESLHTSRGMGTKRTAQNVPIQTGEYGHKTHALVGVDTITDGNAPSFDPSRGDAGARGSGGKKAVAPSDAAQRCAAHPASAAVPSFGQPPQGRGQDDDKENDMMEGLTDLYANLKISLQAHDYNRGWTDSKFGRSAVERIAHSLRIDPDAGVPLWGQYIAFFFKFCDEPRQRKLASSTDGNASWLADRLESPSDGSWKAQYVSWLRKNGYESEMSDTKHGEPSFDTDLLLMVAETLGDKDEIARLTGVPAAPSMRTDGWKPVGGKVAEDADERLAKTGRTEFDAAIGGMPVQLKHAGGKWWRKAR
jgi:hypothetical protein